ncbi:unnamed protein product [Prorocentrum cordatum]|uniref:Uncharacterized protein n=1 Tax=Prorocentrum cordatum TaxID=2364126 RepID=A0ABN9WSW8_9DINO|nr:unnamed protein product [Polarella glacialis]
MQDGRREGAAGGRRETRDPTPQDGWEKQGRAEVQHAGARGQAKTHADCRIAGMAAYQQSLSNHVLILRSRRRRRKKKRRDKIYHNLSPAAGSRMRIRT